MCCTGSNANFQQNYEFTQAFVDAHQAPFLAGNRIWIGGYFYFGQDVRDYDTLPTHEGIQHMTETPPLQLLTHGTAAGCREGLLRSARTASRTSEPRSRAYHALYLATLVGAGPVRGRVEYAAAERPGARPCEGIGAASPWQPVPI